MRALEAAGYSHLQQLSKTTEAELATLHGMGPNAPGKLRQVLAERGLSLTEEKRNFQAYPPNFGYLSYLAFPKSRVENVDFVVSCSTY